VVGYFEDGPNLVTMAMNGWGNTEPDWWLNVQAHPDVSVDLVDGPRQVTGRAAHGDERARLWARWQQIDKNLDAYAARRPIETPVVVFEPRSNRRADGSGSGRARGAEDGPSPDDPVEGGRSAVPAASFEAGASTAGTVKRT
jgi:deazaflavin-dependent oxidoreductase (nitroreductase family)